MPLTLHLLLIVGTLSLAAFAFLSVRSSRMRPDLAVLWLIISIALFLGALFPNFVVGLANILGFKYSPDAVFSALVLGLLFITLFLSVEVTKLNSRVVMIAQEIAILKYKLNEAHAGNRSEIRQVVAGEDL